MIAFPVLAFLAIALLAAMAGVLITAMVMAGAKEDAYRAGMRRGRRNLRHELLDGSWRDCDNYGGTDEDDDLERRTP